LYTALVTRLQETHHTQQQKRISLVAVNFLSTDWTGQLLPINAIFFILADKAFC
jgi:hypothetical protein